MRCISRFALGAAFAALFVCPALAGSGTITTKDASGATRTFSIVTDGSGNFIARQVICDQSAAANCAAVDASNRLSTLPSLVSGSVASGAIASGAVASGAFASGSIATGAFATGSIGSGAIASGAVASGAYASGSIGSGAIASGAFASGAIGSGAVASGAFASGAIASGAIAAGAQVDLLTMRGPKAAGTAAANSLLAGGVYNSGGITLTDGQQASVQFDSAGNLKVSGTGVAAGSTTSGQTMSPIGCAVTTSPPTYTNAQTNFLNCDVPGGLRTSTLNNGVGATGAAPIANVSYQGGNGSGATGGFLRGQIICDQRAFYTGTDNGSKTLVAGVSGRKTYICGWLLATGGTATTLTLFKGTDADCATSGAAIGPPYALVANDRVGMNSATWNGFVTANNADYVCVNASAGNQHTAEVLYAIL